MSGTEPTFGSWNHRADHWPADDQYLQSLWHALAAQTDDQGNITQPNFGLSQRKPEICMLWKLFQWRRPKIVMEVGVSQGGSLASWCRLADDDCLFLAVDRDLNDARPRPGEPGNPAIATPEPLKLSVNGGGIYHLRDRNQKMHGVTGWTTNPAVQMEIKLLLQGVKVDFLFHDASHSSSLFAQDFKWMWPLMAPGGIFAAQDIQESKVPHCDKSVEWDRIKREEEYSALFEFKGSRHDDSMGIGCIFKP